MQESGSLLRVLLVGELGGGGDVLVGGETFVSEERREERRSRSDILPRL
jgi:hypothetical protein